MRNRVAELRRERNMRQEELAAAAGISRQSIIAIEKGRFNPSLEAAIRIARCFGVPVEAVFFPEADGWRCRPETGEAALYKYGAAPTYLKKGGIVRRITGGTLPAGLRGTPAAPDVTHVTLEPGSFAVMISDGVADSARDEWLQNLLAGWEGEDPQVLAGLILSESIHREGLQDDCGIQVLYLPKEGTKMV